MSDTVIKVENVGKLYRLGEVGTGTITHDLNRWWAKVRGKEDPFAKIGETNDRATKGNSDYVWSLKDVSFEVKQGEVLGIIGRNGAGKSTLLKILSKVTTPTTGRIKVKGRIASLLEVGTGFHPELTGRENIYLNGAILGMTKAEIRAKFDEIVDFSGVERYIDTPVKRYSSGMYVRLAFAVAAFLEPEILIVDEVLAVGDAEFQKKCLGRMQDVSKNDGRTVLFVSHNMAAVRQLCSYGILLSKGRVEENSEIDVVIDTYFSSQSKQSVYNFQSEFKGNIITEAYFSDVEGHQCNTLNIHRKAFLNFKLHIVDNKDLNLGFTLVNSEDLNILSTSLLDTFSKIELGVRLYRVEIPTYLLKKGTYRIEAALWSKGHVYQMEDNLLNIQLESDRLLEVRDQGIRGILVSDRKWELCF